MKQKRALITAHLIAFIHDIVMVASAWIGAYAVRQNLSFIPQEVLMQSISLLPAILIMQTSFFIFLVYIEAFGDLLLYQI